MKKILMTAAILFSFILLILEPVFAADAGVVKALTDKIGVTEAQAKGGAGSIFYLAKEKLSTGDFSKVSDSVSGMSGLLESVPDVDALTKGKDLAGSGESGASFLGDAFSKLDMDSGMIGKYVPVLLSYTRDKGGDAVSNVLKSALSSACSTNLVGSLSEKLGVSPEQARGGAGAIFDAAKNALGDKDFNKVSDVIPEMDSLLGAAPKGGSGDMLGGVMKSLGGDAEKLAGAASLAGAFSDLGMDSGMIGQYMPIVLSVVESYGGDTVKNLLQSALE